MKKLKVLFVASGNDDDGKMAPFVRSQRASLEEAGVEVCSFVINGKGAKGYLRNVPKLRARLREEPVDLIHAHYSLSGWVAVLAAGRRFPVVLSLMGDDALGTHLGERSISLKSRFVVLLTFLVQPFVKAIIYKSPNLEVAIWRRRIAHLIPNGVRVEQFRQLGRDCRKLLDLEADKKYVLFLGNPDDPNKNIALARAAVGLLNRPEVKLLNIFGVSHDQVIQYLNAVDVFVLCSFAEGSPNVVKEAMACNCPMVVTDVGDVRRVIGETEGCYIASFEPAGFARGLRQALAFVESKGRTKGRARIRALGLDAATVAGRLQKVYEGVLPDGPHSSASERVKVAQDT